MDHYVIRGGSTVSKSSDMMLSFNFTVDLVSSDGNAGVLFVGKKLGGAANRLPGGWCLTRLLLTSHHTLWLLHLLGRDLLLLMTARLQQLLLVRGGCLIVTSVLRVCLSHTAAVGIFHLTADILWLLGSSSIVGRLHGARVEYLATRDKFECL